MPERLCCQKCGRELSDDPRHPSAAVYMRAAWGDADQAHGGRKLVTCRPCSEPVIDALKAVLAPNRR
jgi:hypothetical protein